MCPLVFLSQKIKYFSGLIYSFSPKILIDRQCVHFFIVIAVSRR